MASVQGDFAFIDHKSFEWVKNNSIVAFFTRCARPSDH